MLIAQTEGERCMKSISIEFPESLLATLNLNSETFAKEVRIALAVKLFEIGRLTSGQAADLAKLSRRAFLTTCPQFGCPSVIWDKEELEEEFKRP